MQFKDLEIGDRFTVPGWKRDPSNLKGQYGIKLSEMKYEVRSDSENPRLIRDCDGNETISSPSDFYHSTTEVRVLPKLERSFKHNNCLPIVGQRVWFYDNHIGGAPSMYCNVRFGIVQKMFQEMCKIVECNADTITVHTSAVYDHQPQIKEELIKEFWAEYFAKVLI